MIKMSGICLDRLHSMTPVGEYIQHYLCMEVWDDGIMYDPYLQQQLFLFKGS